MNEEGKDCQGTGQKRKGEARINFSNLIELPAAHRDKVVERSCGPKEWERRGGRVPGTRKDDTAPKVECQGQAVRGAGQDGSPFTLELDPVDGESKALACRSGRVVLVHLTYFELGPNTAQGMGGGDTSKQTQARPAGRRYYG